MIETRYDPETDVLHVRFGGPEAVYDGADEVSPGVYVEYDASGDAIGVEITSALRTRREKARVQDAA